MQVPGLGPAALPLPIVHSDHPPPEQFAEFFDVHTADQWNEHWALVDLDAAQKVTSSFIESFNLLQRFPRFIW